MFVKSRLLIILVFRKLVVDCMSTAEEMIDSPGIVVEIDESIFIQLKCDRGKRCSDSSLILEVLA